MSDKPETNSVASLARNLRVGLLGSPYEWSALDFDQFQRRYIAPVFLTSPNSRESCEQDLLIDPSSENDQRDYFVITQADNSVLVGNLPASSQSSLSADWIFEVFGYVVNQVDDAVSKLLIKEDEDFIGTERIIARYGTEVLRVCSVLRRRQVHIENEALAHLIASQWQNESELDFLVAWMVFHLEGDVIRKNYVQETMNKMGTLSGGNTIPMTLYRMISQFTWEVISKSEIQTAIRLFKTQLAPMKFAMPTREAASQRKRAA